MTVEQLKADHADLVEAIVAEATSGMIAKEEADKTAAAATERVCGLVSATMGAEVGDKLTALVQSGISAEQATTLGIKIENPAVVVDEQSRAAILAGIQAAAPAGVQVAATPATEADERKALAASIASGATKR